MTKKMTNDEQVAVLVEQALAVAQIHLKNLSTKARVGEISAAEGATLCSYLKTLSAIEKANKLDKKEMQKDVSQMTDAQLQEHIRELTLEALRGKSEN